jgi:hypothetical protein
MAYKEDTRLSKSPSDLPAVGDIVRLKGRGGRGIIVHITRKNWVEMDWDAGSPHPKICHLFELEKIPE